MKRPRRPVALIAGGPRLRAKTTAAARSVTDSAPEAGRRPHRRIRGLGWTRGKHGKRASGPDAITGGPERSMDAEHTDEVEQPTSSTNRFNNELGADGRGGPGVPQQWEGERRRLPRSRNAYDKSKKHVPTMLTTTSRRRSTPGPTRRSRGTILRASGPFRGDAFWPAGVVQASTHRDMGPIVALPSARSFRRRRLPGPGPDPAVDHRDRASRNIWTLLEGQKILALACRCPNCLPRLGASRVDVSAALTSVAERTARRHSLFAPGRGLGRSTAAQLAAVPSETNSKKIPKEFNAFAIRRKRKFRSPT